MEKKRILIVDDDEIILKKMKEVLTREGYSVFTSDQSLGTSQKVSTIKPNLVIMDVMMPGLAGDRICKILKDSYIGKDMKIILYSAKDQDELEKLAERAEADDFLKKSDNYQELINKINSLLKNSE
jgi:DNA-binding response OmpR family regulator